MDVKLEGLIEKIRKEGVEGGRKASDELIKKAKDEADSILSEAKKKAEKMVADAEEKTNQFQKNGELALQQAARDSLLLVKERLYELFDRVFKQEISAALKPDILKELILAIISKWADKSHVEITLSKEDKKKLETVLFKGVKKKLKETVTIQASSDLTHGFRIGLKENDVYYDFSDETIAEMLKIFLNPRLKEILDGKNG